MAKSKNVISPSYESDWQAQDDMRTLIEAEKIKRDPKRLKAARKQAKAKAKEMLIMAEAAKSLASDK